jgi:hypothetical protein
VNDPDNVVDPVVLAERRARRAELAEEELRELLRETELGAASLKGRLAAVEAELATARTQRDALAVDLARREKELIATSQREQTEQALRSEAQTRAAEATSGSRRELDDLRIRLVAAEQRASLLTQVEAEVSERLARAVASETELVALRAEVQSRQSDIAALRAELDRHAAQEIQPAPPSPADPDLARRIAQERTAFAAHVAAVEHTVAGLRPQLAAASAALADGLAGERAAREAAEAQLEAERDKVRKLQEGLAAATAREAAVAEVVAELSASVAALRERFADELEARVAELSGAAEALRVELGQEHDRASAARDELERLRAERSAERDELEGERAAREAAEAQLERLRLEHEELARRQAERSGERDELERDQARLAAALERLETEQAQHTATMGQLEREQDRYAEAQAELDRLRAEHAELTLEQERREERRADLEREQERLAAALEEVEQARKQQAAELQETEQGRARQAATLAELGREQAQHAAAQAELAREQALREATESELARERERLEAVVAELEELRAAGPPPQAVDIGELARAAERLREQVEAQAAAMQCREQAAGAPAPDPGTTERRDDLARVLAAQQAAAPSYDPQRDAHLPALPIRAVVPSHDEGAWLREGIRRVGRGDPALATQLLLALVPAQAQVLRRDVAYRLTVGDVGTWRVALTGMEAVIEPGESDEWTAFRLSGSAGDIAALVAGGGRRKLTARVEGSRRALWRVARACRSAPTLAQAAAAGGHLSLRAVLALLAAVAPDGGRSSVTFDDGEQPITAVGTRGGAVILRTGPEQAGAVLRAPAEDLVALLIGLAPAHPIRVAGDVAQAASLVTRLHRAQGLR